MNKFSTIFTFILAVVIFQFIGIQDAATYTAGAPSGRTGSPGDNNMSCAQTGCHSGTASGGSVSINTDIPASGYIPGQQYSVDVTVMQTGVSKFGFSITSEDVSHNRVGSFVGTANVQTTNGDTYATHRSSSTAGSDSKTWSFSWTAPASGTGNVTFYSAGNASNNNNNANGDAIYTSSILVTEDLASGLNELLASEIQLSPNPAVNELWLEAPSINSPLQVQLFNANGKLILSKQLTSPNSGRHMIDLSNVESGIYFVTLSLEGHLSYKKLAVAK